MKPVVLSAILLIALDIGYRYSRGKPPTEKGFMGWLLLIILLQVLSLGPLENIGEMIAWIFIVSIILNDGYDVIRGVTTAK